MGALIGLGVNLPEDAIYPASFVDDQGKPYSGANSYVLHFDKGKLPPANAFWSVTLYDKDGFQVPNALSRFAIGDRDKLKFNADAFWSVTLYDKDGFQVPNTLNRFALGDRDKLAFNPDGSLDILIQSESPGAGKESNWLPAPAGEFNLALRLYSPKREALDGTWTPPAVKKVN